MRLVRRLSSAVNLVSRSVAYLDRAGGVDVKLEDSWAIHLAEHDPQRAVMSLKQESFCAGPPEGRDRFEGQNPRGESAQAQRSNGTHDR